MKNLFVVTFLILAMLLVACDTLSNDKKLEGSNETGSSDTQESTSESNTESENAIDVTVDEIIEMFDKSIYYAQEYDDTLIATVNGNIANMGINLNGGISRVIHITNQSVSRDDPSWSWAYIYELSNEADAILIEENRREYVDATNSGVCVRFGLIVVFGTSPVIQTIEK